MRHAEQYFRTLYYALYKFTLYVLDCELHLPSNVFKKAFLKSAEGHILQKGEITGEFVGK